MNNFAAILVSIAFVSSFAQANSQTQLYKQIKSSPNHKLVHRSKCEIPAAGQEEMIEVTLLSENSKYASILSRLDSSCGHGSVNFQIYTFEKATGQILNDERLFNLPLMDGQGKISASILDLMINAEAKNTTVVCKDFDNESYSSAVRENSYSVDTMALTPAGLQFAAGLDDSSRACKRVTTIPFSELSKYLTPAGKAVQTR